MNGINNNKFSLYKTEEKESERQYPYATIAIATYKRENYLVEALDSVINQITVFPYNIFILDNNCDSNLKKKVSEVSVISKVEVVYIPVPELGLHNCRNTAAKLCNSEVIVYIDDDILAPEGWLQSLCSPFINPSVSGVAGKTVAKWEGEKPDWVEAIPSEYFSVLNLGTKTFKMTWPQTPFGCNMAFRRTLILKYGGFPPDGFGNKVIEWRRGDGETGFSEMLYKSDQTIMYSPEGWLYHRIPQSRMTLSFVMKRGIKAGIGEYYFRFKKNPIHPTHILFHAAINSVKSAIYALIVVLGLITKNHVWPIRFAKMWRLIGMTLYQFRLSFDKDLRKWVSKKNFT